MYDDLVEEIYNQILARIQSLHKHEPVIVFVCGLGGSGKTFFAHQLQEKIGRSAVSFHTDWYATYSTSVRKERIQEAIDSGDSIRIEQEENPRNWYSWLELQQGLKTLQSTGHLHIPNAWNQETGEKDLEVECTLQDHPSGVIICDGIYLLHPEMEQSADVIIYLSVSKNVVLERANKRDGHRSSSEYLAYKASLLDKYDLEYYKQYEQKADIVINNDDFASMQIVRLDN